MARPQTITNEDLLKVVHANLSHAALQSRWKIVHINITKWREVLGVNELRLRQVLAELLVNNSVQVTSKGGAFVDSKGCLRLGNGRKLKIRVKRFLIQGYNLIPGLQLSQESIAEGLKDGVLSKINGSSSPGRTGELNCITDNTRIHISTSTLVHSTSVQCKSTCLLNLNEKTFNQRQLNSFDNHLLLVPPKRRQQSLVVDAIKSKAQGVSNYRLVSFELLLKKLCEEVFGYAYFCFRKHTDYNHAKVIIATCELRGWDTEDFLRVNLIWFRNEFNRFPQLNALASQNAEIRYDAFLRQSGYLEEGSDLNLRLNPALRIKELTRERTLRSRKELLESQGRLYNQALESATERAERFGEDEKKRLKGLSKERRFTLISQGRPKWLGETEEQLLEFYIQKVKCQKREEFLRGWRTWEEERGYIIGLICSIEREGIISSEVLKYSDRLPEYCLPAEVLEIHNTLINNEPSQF